jgi:hypothetical protein
VNLFKKTKTREQTQQDEGPREEELAVITSAVASFLQQKTTTTKGTIKRTPHSPWKLMGMKDQMVYGKQRRGVKSD